MTNIAFKQAHSGNYRRAARGKEDIRYLVIHFTANDGDTAKNNADYFARAEISTSAHYFVDENEVWQSVRDEDIAWHCGTRGVYFHPYCRNANSIGIELCSRKNGEKFYFMPETVRRAQALILAGCRVLPVRMVLRVLVFPVVLPAAGIVCRAALFAAGLRVFWSAARRAAARGVLGGIAPLPLRRAAGLGLSLGGELDAVICPGGAHTAVGAAGGRAAERLAVVAVAAAAGAPGRMILRRRRGARHIPVQVIGSRVPGSAVAVTVLLHHSHLLSCLFRSCITGSLPA